MHSRYERCVERIWSGISDYRKKHYGKSPIEIQISPEDLDIIIINSFYYEREAVFPHERKFYNPKDFRGGSLFGIKISGNPDIAPECVLFK